MTLLASSLANRGEDLLVYTDQILKPSPLIASQETNSIRRRIIRDVKEKEEKKGVPSNRQCQYHSHSTNEMEFVIRLFGELQLSSELASFRNSCSWKSSRLVPTASYGLQTVVVVV